MDQVAYEAYAEEARTSAEQNFSAYKFRVAAFAALGYVIIVGLLIVLLGITGGLVATAFFSSALFLLLLKKKVLFILVPVIWVMIRALWVRFERPQGYELERERCPELFRELDVLRAELDSLPVHRVLLTPEFNAAVVQTPRLGVFGWNENTLFLGLELLLTLTPEQARAVIAHELGHLSGNHSRFNGWIYRVRMSWFKILHGLENNDSIGSAVLIKFFNWYAPRFSAYSFPLARFNEYEADAVSAELTSAQDAAAALVNVHVTAPFVDETYWKKFFRKADEKPEPEHLPWQGLSEFLDVAEPDDLQDRLDQAMAEETNFADTHPSLKDRLAALGTNASVAKPEKNNAATAWLGESYADVVNDFDKQWQEDYGEKWRNRFEYVQASQKTLAEIEERQPDTLTDDELWQLANLRWEFRTPDEAISTFRQYQARNPESPDCAYSLGILLRDKQDPACIDEFRKSLSNPSIAYEAACMAYYFVKEHGADQELEYWQNAADTAGQQQAAAQQERGNLKKGDPLLEPDLDDENLQKIIAQLKASKLVGKIWVARKETEHYKDIPIYAFAVTIKGLSFSEDSAAKKILETLDPFDGWLVPKAGNYKPLAKYIIKHGTRV